MLSHSKKAFTKIQDVKYISKVCSSLLIKRYSTDEAPCRNLFEVYQKNQHWLGQYERHPVLKEKIKNAELTKIIGDEKNRLAPIDLDGYINENRTEWTQGTRRTGAVGRKLGMSVLWTNEGFRHAVTLVQIGDCRVIDTQISREDGGNDSVTQLILAAGDMTNLDKIANTSREKLKWYIDRGVFPKEYWAAFQVTKNALLHPGTEITASHFKPGQFVHLRGTTIYQGFQGVMKRWGMKGQPKTHGQTKTHRKMGATGGGQDPGRIFPGKKMAGVVGGKNSTTPPLKILRINTKHNILYVKGHVPGEVGGYLRIHDCRFKPYAETPHFPTISSDDVTSLDEDLFDVKVCRPSDMSLEFPPHKL